MTHLHKCKFSNQLEFIFGFINNSPKHPLLTRSYPKFFQATWNSNLTKGRRPLVSEGSTFGEIAGCRKNLRIAESDQIAGNRGNIPFQGLNPPPPELLGTTLIQSKIQVQHQHRSWSAGEIQAKGVQSDETEPEGRVHGLRLSTVQRWPTATSSGRLCQQPSSVVLQMGAFLLSRLISVLLVMWEKAGQPEIPGHFPENAFDLELTVHGTVVHNRNGGTLGDAHFLKQRGSRSVNAKERRREGCNRGRRGREREVGE